MADDVSGPARYCLRHHRFLPVFYLPRATDRSGAKSHLWSSRRHPCDSSLQEHYHGRQVVALFMDRCGAYVYLAYLGRRYAFRESAGV